MEFGFMQDTGMRLKRDFGMGFARFIRAGNIWPVLDDGNRDSEKNVREVERSNLDTEPVTLTEMETYHRQLFYWLLNRGGAGIFPPVEN